MRPALLLLRGSAIAFALSALGAPAGAAEPDTEMAKRLAALTAERDELARRVAEQSAWLEAAAEEQRALLLRLRSLTGNESDRSRLAVQVAELTAQLEESETKLAQVRAEGVSWASTTTAVNLRSGPGTEHRRLETLPVGTRVELTGRGEGWARVRAASREGWVAADYLRAESDEVDALRGRIGELEERLEAAGRESAVRAAELERQVTESSEARARLADQLGELAARNSALEAANTALETSRRELAAELASARSEVARMDRQSASQTEEIRERLRAAESVAAELLAWLESLQSEKTEAEAE